MILTKDNLLRFVREKKAVTPTMVAEAFDTTTMIGSAALSELAKDKLVLITNLKLSSSPYYYDPKQRECLIDIGLNFYSKYEKEILIKLKEKEILPDTSLTIQEKLAIEKIRDFANPLDIVLPNYEMRFWVWYLRNLEETKTQILEALNQQTKPVEKRDNIKEEIKKTVKPNVEEKKNNQINTNNINANVNNTQQNIKQNLKNSSNNFEKYEEQRNIPNKNMNIKIQENQTEKFIENFLRENYLQIDTKQKDEKGILYQTNLSLGQISIQIDAYHFFKKVSEQEIIKFYNSSMKPKIVFIENCPKKIFKLAETIENLSIINI